VVIVVMGREFIVSGLRTIAMSEGIIIAAGAEGKQKAAFQVAAITFLLLHYTYPVEVGRFVFEFDANRVGTILLFVSIFFSAWSMIDYFVGFVRAVYRAPQA
jgi:CDP-diacylglycerol--glycerol-3-phosphate 3-phosphatidyltransferase